MNSIVFLVILCWIQYTYFYFSIISWWFSNVSFFHEVSFSFFTFASLVQQLLHLMLIQVLLLLLIIPLLCLLQLNI